MMKYKAVLFDMDGTLLDTLTDLADAVNHILSVHGYPLRTVEEARGGCGSAPGRRRSPATHSRRCWRSTGWGTRPIPASGPRPIPA